MIIRVRNRNINLLMFKTMKKTYIIPQVELHTMSVEGLIAASDPKVSLGDGTVEAASVDVKSSRPDNYNVWDEDWSK